MCFWAVGVNHATCRKPTWTRGEHTNHTASSLFAVWWQRSSPTTLSVHFLTAENYWLIANVFQVFILIFFISSQSVCINLRYEMWLSGFVVLDITCVITWQYCFIISWSQKTQLDCLASLTVVIRDLCELAVKVLTFKPREMYSWGNGFKGKGSWSFRVTDSIMLVYIMKFDFLDWFHYT